MNDHDAQCGTVYLVGSGPGDPELLTVKASRLIDRADVVLHDALTGDAIVDSIPASTRVVDVSKGPTAGKRTSQAEINRRMVSAARAGETVVRLKGGDPLVFGRGGEEAEHLAEAGVDFEIVPGVTSPVAAGSVSAIPLTHREYSSSLTFVTGHERPSKDESMLDWDALADTVTAGGTLVVLMGVRSLPDVVSALVDRGVSPDLPVAMVEKATWDDEATVTATLDTIEAERRAAGIEPPALIIVGEVVAVREAVRERLATAALEAV